MFGMSWGCLGGLGIGLQKQYCVSSVLWMFLTLVHVINQNSYHLTKFDVGGGHILWTGCYLVISDFGMLLSFPTCLHGLFSCLHMHMGSFLF